MKQTVSSYIDDLFIQLDMISCEQLIAHLKRWGLVTKPSEILGDPAGVRVLGLKVGDDLNWGRDSQIPDIDVTQNLTRREVSAYIGTLLGHFPVAGWLRVVCGYLQRLISEDNIGWDDRVSLEVKECLRKIKSRLEVDDPVKGQWVVDSDAPLTVWADASSLAIGVVLQVNGQVIEDASWLRPKNDTAHINKSELEAVIRGLNLAVQWCYKTINVMTDSSNVFSWLQNTINKTKNVKTRALEGLLIRRRLGAIAELIQEENLSVTVKLVKSCENKADVLTRIPANFILKKEEHHRPTIYSFDDIKAIHESRPKSFWG